MSESLGRITSAGVPIEWKGREYILGKFSFRDRGLIENTLIREKRRRKMQVVLDMKEMLPPDEYREQFDNARREAELIGSVSESDVEKYLMTNEGLAMFLWILFEDRYPGEVTRVDIEEMFAKGAITEHTVLEIFMLIKDALGVGQAGNLTGHNRPPDIADFRRRRRRSRRRKA
jgi:hypothetical protein